MITGHHQQQQQHCSSSLINSSQNHHQQQQQNWEDQHSQEEEFDTPHEKRVRITKACDNCRKRRVKCSGTNPCAVCTSQGIQCTFTASSKKRGPPSLSEQLKILEQKLEILQTALVRNVPESEETIKNLFNQLGNNQYHHSLPIQLNSESNSNIHHHHDGSSNKIEQGDDLHTHEPCIDHHNHNSTGMNQDPGSITHSFKTQTNHVTYTPRPSHYEHTRRQIASPSFSINKRNMRKASVEHQQISKNEEATFVKDLNDHLQYLGPTSAFDNRVLKESPLYKNGVFCVPMTNRDNRTLVDIPETISQRNPYSKELILYLASLYFTTIHKYYPIVDENDFHAHLFSDQLPSDDFVFMLNAMMALVTQSIENLEDWNIPNTYMLHLEFVKRTRTLLANQLDKATLFNIQGFMLVSLCGLAGVEQFNFWVYIGIAIRLCHEHGMHRNLSGANFKLQIPSKRLQLLKRTWFVVYMLDRVCSLLFGRPMMIRDEEVEPGNFSLDEQVLEDPEFCIGIKAAVGLVKILGEISIIGNSMHMSNRTAKVEEALASLRNWYNELPIEFQKLLQCEHDENHYPLDEITTSSGWHPLHLLAMYYHICEILLLRMKPGVKIPESTFLTLVKIMERIPKESLRNGHYQSPLVVYIINIVASCWLLDIHKEENWPLLRKTLHALSKLEPYFQFSFKSRLLILEFLASKRIDPVQVLGTELATAYPICSSVDVNSRYYILFKDLLGDSNKAAMRNSASWPSEHRGTSRSEAGSNTSGIVSRSSSSNSGSADHLGAHTHIPSLSAHTGSPLSISIHSNLTNNVVNSLVDSNNNNNNQGHCHTMTTGLNVPTCSSIASNHQPIQSSSMIGVTTSSSSSITTIPAKSIDTRQPHIHGHENSMSPFYLTPSHHNQTLNNSHVGGGENGESSRNSNGGIHLNSNANTNVFAENMFFDSWIGELFKTTNSNNL